MLKSFQYEMRAIFTESLIHKTFYWSNETHMIIHKLENLKLELNETLEISFFHLYIFFIYAKPSH